EDTKEQARAKTLQIARRYRCMQLTNSKPKTETVQIDGKEQGVDVLPFDLARAHMLYKALFGPVEEMIKGKRILIVPSGPLTILPFSVLVTVPPKVAIPTNLAGYRGVAWLGVRQAVT